MVIIPYIPLLIFGSFAVLTQACSQPQKAPSVPISPDFDAIEQQFSYYFHTIAYQYSIPSNSLELPIPDRFFWEERIEFVDQTSCQLDDFLQYFKEDSLAILWQNRLLQIDSLAIANSLQFYSISAHFEQLLHNKNRSRTQRLETFNHQLRTFPSFMKEAIPVINQATHSKIRVFEKELEQQYFLLKNDLPSHLKLRSQEKHIQNQIRQKTQEACLTIKNLLSYCRSKRNETSLESE